jgi:uncharacterized protein YndB with AHSA1/START domain
MPSNATPPRRSISASIEIQSTPAHLFSIWTQVDHWHLWDPDTQGASLLGPAAMGVTGQLVPTQGRRVPMAVALLEPDRRIQFRCPVMGSALHFDHRLTPLASGRVLATHEAWFTGWATPLLRAMLARQLTQNLPVTVASLKRYAEEGITLPGRR